MPATVDRTTSRQRIVEAAACLGQPLGGVTGWAALHWAGATWLDGRSQGGRVVDPVTLALGEGNLRPQSGIEVCREQLRAHELVDVDGVRLTEHVRSTCFAMRYAAGVRAAVVVADMAMRADLVDVAELTAYVEAHPAWTGIPQARAALPLVEENSWSPAETRTRLVWELDAGLPRPLCNAPVFDLNGEHLATPDLFDPTAGLAVEYDGSVHLAGTQRRKDVDREDLLRSHGIAYVTVLAGHLLEPESLAARLLRVRDRALATRPDLATWTVVPPPWWRGTTTVAARRALHSSAPDG